MKNVSLAAIFILMTCSLKAQETQNPTDTTIDGVTYIKASNSYKEIFRRQNPDLKYDYDEQKRTHNYSGNWDFDGDGHADSLYLIGNNGVHTYFFLRIILSGKNTQLNYGFISIDLPKLETRELLEQYYDETDYIPQFVVSDFTKDGRPDIYVSVDTRINPLPRAGKKRGITSGRLLLTSNGKGIRIKNFVPAW